MLSTWMLYALAASLLLACAGWSAERALRARDVPARWIWAACLIGSALLATLPVLVPEPAPRADSTAPSPPRAPTGAAAPTEAPRHSRLPTDLDPWIAGVWGLLSLTSLGVLAYGAIRLARARRRWSRQRVDGRDVWISRNTGPAVVGLLRPEIVVPRWSLELDPLDRALVLRHEEEHRRARDPLLLALGLLLAVLAPWNLALRWQLARLRLAVEVDCDRRVLRGATDARRYALLLLEMGGRARHGAGAGDLALARSAPFLERRIRIMTSPRSPGAFATLCLATLSGFFVLAACTMERPALTDPEPAPSLSADPGPDGEGPFEVDLRSEPGVVVGMVRSAGGGEPLPAAVVSIPGLGIATRTNVQGRFLLLNVPGGAHRLRVSHETLGAQDLGEVVVRAAPPREPAAGEVPREEVARARPDAGDTVETAEDLARLRAAMERSLTSLVEARRTTEAARLEQAEALRKLRAEETARAARVVERLSADARAVEEQLERAERAQALRLEEARRALEASARRLEEVRRQLPLPPSRAGDRTVVVGTTVHPVTREPLGAVRVTIEGTDLEVVANRQGRFLLLNAPPGPRTLRLRHPDHGEWTLRVDVVAGETTDVGRVGPPAVR